MSKEKYFIEIGDEGSSGLGRLDYCFNPTTKAFLQNLELTKGMNVLDIGCGSGTMTCWLAEQVGNIGHILAIENDENQLNAAKNYAKQKNLNNIEFKLCSAYDIETLNQTFDLVYCRFLLHHLHDPKAIIKKIYHILKPNGMYAAEEGIVNYSFSYPHSPAWGDESVRLPAVWVDAPVNQRDGNIGVKMFNKMQAAGFKIISAKIIHPLLSTRNEKLLLIQGREELKQSFLDQGHTESEWKDQTRLTQEIIDNDAQIIGFYASCQVAGKKS